LFFSLRPLLSPVHSLSSPLLPPSQQQQQKPSIDRKGVYVELGAKSPAFCASSELSVARVERAADFVQPGDAREFVVLREDQRSGELQLSIRRAEEALVWRRLRQSLEEGAAVEGLVTSFNAAGLMVDVQGQKGFVPGSHVPNNVLPEDLVGRRLSLKLLEVDEERQRLVLSNRRRASSSGGRTFRVGAFRSFLEPPLFSPSFFFWVPPLRKKREKTHFLLSSLSFSLFPPVNNDKKIGDVVVGTVAAVQVYGAFVDLGGGVNGELTEKVSLLLRSSFSFSSSSLRGREAKNKTKAHSLSPPPL
jgi:predicted RNA-binding protein with RPS1 domain